MKVSLTILGQPCSKANGREIATIGPKDARRMIVRKSDDGIAYEKAALLQIPPRCRVELTGPVRVTLRLFYGSEQPDLDESIVLDVMQTRWTKRDKITGARRLLQKGVYGNDRQVREKHVYHAIDRINPRAEIEVEAMTPQQVTMPQALFDEAEIPF